MASFWHVASHVFSRLLAGKSIGSDLRAVVFWRASCFLEADGSSDFRDSRGFRRSCPSFLDSWNFWNDVLEFFQDFLRE